MQPGSEIANVSDLKGQKIITTTGTTADIFLQRALDKAGLTRKDVTVVNSPMPDAVQAFNSGAVPAIALWVPFDLQVKKAVVGASEIANAGQYPNAAVGDGWIANNDYYAKNQKTIKKIIAAWQTTNAAWQQDPEGSLKKVWEVAYKKDLTLADLTHQAKFQTNYSNEEWVKRYQNGDVLKVVGQAEQAFVDLGGLKSYVEPDTFFDTALFVDVAKG